MIELNTIYNEDCLIGMSRISDKSIDMILCDLPYGTTTCKWDVIIPFEPLWEQYERVIKDNGAIVLTASQPFTSMLVMSNISMFRYEWIWNKVVPTGFLNAPRQPLKKHESVLVFSKSTHTYNRQYTDRSASDLKRIGKGKLKNTEYSTNVYGAHKNGMADDFKFDKVNPLSIIEFSSGNGWAKKNNVHPTQKPVALFEYLIKTYTNEGETVLDNCMGSGTTAIACINTNRNYIGFEKEEKYFQIAQERIKKHIPQLKLKYAI